MYVLRHVGSRGVLCHYMPMSIADVLKLLYLGKRFRMDILTVVAFLRIRVTKAAEGDDGKLLRVLKYIRDRSSIERPARNNSGGLRRCIA